MDNDSDQDSQIDDNGVRRPSNSNRTSKRKRQRPDLNQKTRSVQSLDARTLGTASSRSSFAVETELDWTSIAFINNYSGFTRMMSKRTRASLNEVDIKWRVVALCEMRVVDHSNGDRVIYENDYMCSGTVVEMPLNINYNRCLVFFDNGIARYLQPSNVFPIFDLFTPPYERLHLDHSKFLKNYFDEYPNRNMVQLKPGHLITIFFNGLWRKHVTVKDTDCSLMQVTLTSELTLENEPNKSKSAQLGPDVAAARYSFSFWIFRGSFSLQPMFDNAISRANAYNPSTSKPFYKYVSDKTSFRLDRYEKLRLRNNLSVFASSMFPEQCKLGNKNAKIRNG